jgi:nucleotide-binding universal stress UspA family protein
MRPTVVVPLDKSSKAEISLPIAAALAHQTEGMILLISVIEAPSEIGAWLHAEEAVEAWVDHHMDVDQYLTRIADGISGAPADTLVSTGNPSVEINAIAQDQVDPVIVMASHARTGVSRITVGSVAASVIHDARCPVIVVRRTDEESAAPLAGALKRLVVALDGSEFAEQALSSAQAVLGGTGLDIHLLRVVETNKWYGSTYAQVDYAAMQLYIDAEREVATTYMKDKAAELELAGNIVTWDVCEGLVADHISQATGSFNADLIVMSTHGRTGLRRMLMGSVAERVIHDSGKPVMLVNPQAMAD